MIIQATFGGGSSRDEQGKVLEREAEKEVLRELWSAFGFLLVVVVTIVVGVITGMRFLGLYLGREGSLISGGEKENV